jgi:hypothetical protein
VLGSTAGLLNQNNQQQMQGALGDIIKQGAFGGDRAGIAAANLAQQQNLANANIYSGIASDAFQQALATAQQQQGVNLGAAQANRAALQQTGAGLAGLGAGAQGAALQGAQAQLAAGQAQQQTGQAGLTALYNQFLQQQSYPFQVAQFLANIAEGTGALSGSTTTTTQPGGFFSDKRLKTGVIPVGKTFDGQNIVAFRYRGEPHVRMGLIAQEVEKKHPEAVGEAAGFKTVDYGKATEDAADRGHFYRGGVIPANDNAHEEARKRYAYGGQPLSYNYPSLPGESPFDIAAMLAAQAEMYAPYAGAGLYGGQATGAPRGGSSYVPQATVPVGHLAVAGGLAPRQDPFAQAKEISGLASEGAKGLSWLKGKFGKFGGDNSADDSGGDDIPADVAASALDDSSNVVPFKRGGFARLRYAIGGDAPYDDNGPGLDIPNETPKNLSLPTPGAPPKSQSGLSGLGQAAGIGSDIATIGTAAAKFLPFLLALKHGGRAGYDDGGSIDDGGLNLVDPLPPETGGNPLVALGERIGRGVVNAAKGAFSNPTFATEFAGATGGADAPSIPAAGLAGLANAPPSPAAPPPASAPAPAHHAVRHAGPTGVAPSGFSAADIASISGPEQPNVPMATATDATVTPIDAGGAGLSNLSPVTGRLRGPSAADLAGTPSDTTQGAPASPGGFGGLGGYFKHLVSDPQQFMPLLAGIAAMGTYPTVHPGVALAAGLGGYANAYMQTREQLAEIARTQAQTGVQQQVAMREVPPGPPGTRAMPGVGPDGKSFPGPDGKPWHYELTTGTTDFGAGPSGALTGQPVAPAAAAVQSAATRGRYAFDANGRATLQPSSNTDADMAKLGAQPGAVGVANTARFNAMNPALAEEGKAEEAEAQREVGDVQQNLATVRNMGQLGVALGGLPETGLGTVGAGYAERQQAANYVATVERAFGITPDPSITGQLEASQMIDKIKLLQSAAFAHMDNIRAASFANMLNGVLPNGNFQKGAAMEVWAQMAAQARQPLDLNDYAPAYLSRYGTGYGMLKSFSRDADYPTDVSALRAAATRTDPSKPSAAEYLIAHPDQRAAFEKRYGPGSSRYWIE